MMFQILINEKAYDMEFAENKTSADIIQMLPLKLSMQAYSDIEYYAELPERPFFDEKATVMQAKEKALMYCREYNALVVVCRNHHDIFREVPVGRIIGNPSWENKLNSRIAAEIKVVSK